MKYSDQFIYKLRNGDKKAFEQVYNDLNISLCAFANKYLNDMDISIDVVQDVFISFWNSKESLKYGTAVKSYLYTTTRNKSINYIRKNSTKEKLHKDYADLQSDSMCEFNMLKEEVYDELYQSIQELPKKSKIVMTLTLDGMSNAEITDELKVSINTVKTIKRTSYQKIRERIKNFLEN